MRNKFTKTTETVFEDETNIKNETADRLNKGHNNAENWNTGHCNAGSHNTGSHNTGNWNTGSFNSGDWNTGDCNEGHWNNGDWNAGSHNTGHWNIGNDNTGRRNTGNFNAGNCNNGSYNTGRYNAGSWNRSSYNTGCFNIEQHKILMFDRPSEWTYEDWMGSKAREILENMPKGITEWVGSEDMTDEEKEEHPAYETIGGYLKKSPAFERKAKRQKWWDGLDEEEKEIIKSLPNFNPDIFEKCTEIKVKD